MAMIAIIARAVPERLRAVGQASMYLVVFTVGSILGYASAGWLRQLWGVEAPYEVAAALDLLIALPLYLVATRAARLDSHNPSNNPTESFDTIE